MSEGCFTFWAQTIPASVTLPSHTSMLTGVGLNVHGVDWNKDTPPEDRYPYPRAQTLFDLAKRNGLTTSIFASKGKFSALAQPGTIDWGYINRRGEGLDDPTLAGVAADSIRAYKPNVVFMHIGHSDVIGHGSDDWYPREHQGWGSPLQILSLQEADYCVGKVVQALKDAGIYQDTLIILSADHGGSSYSHGPDDPRSRHIPWICVGPEVKKNFDLTRHKNLVVKTEDTFATACYFLGIKPPEGITGKPIKEVIAQRELLMPAP
jgi:arylsulfatase A-like enzyme